MSSYFVCLTYVTPQSELWSVGKSNFWLLIAWLRTGGTLFLWCLVSQGQIWRVSSKLILLDLSSDMVSSKLILMNLSYFSFPLSFSCVLPSDCLCWAEVSEAVSDTSEQCPPNSLPSNSFQDRFTVKTFHWKCTWWKFVRILGWGENQFDQHQMCLDLLTHNLTVLWGRVVKWKTGGELQTFMKKKWSSSKS